MPDTRPRSVRPRAAVDALENAMTSTSTLAARRRGGAAIWLAAALGLGLGALSGCASKQAYSEAPGAEAPPMYDQGSSLDELERALADEERRLRSAGVRLPAAGADLAGVTGGADAAYSSEDAASEAPESAPAEVADASTEPHGRDAAKERRRECSDVCGLSASICDLEGHICGLAARHPGEDRYAQVCERASGDCRAAREACDGCS